MTERGAHLSWFDEALLALKCQDAGVATAGGGGTATQSEAGVWSRVIDGTTGKIRVVSV